MKNMTPEKHLSFLLLKTEFSTRKKYMAGQKEHGGQLWRKPVMDFIGEEITDLNVYWYTFVQQWAQLKDMVYSLYLDEHLPQSLKPKVGAMLNLMEEGNEEGILEEEK